jgi:hypothetical protein
MSANEIKKYDYFIIGAIIVIILICGGGGYFMTRDSHVKVQATENRAVLGTAGGAKEQQKELNGDK